MLVIPTKTRHKYRHMSAEISQGPSFFRGFIQGKTRIVLAWVFAFSVLFFASGDFFWEGALVCFLGATLRFWASGFIHKDGKVSVGGPYGYVRNPLYVGTYCMMLGTCLAIDAMAMAIICTVFYGWIYHYIVLDEETKLKGLFGKPYETYLKTVPRFIPRITPVGSEKLLAINSEAGTHRFSWDVARKNKALEAYYAFVGLMALVGVGFFIHTLLA